MLGLFKKTEKPKTARRHQRHSMAGCEVLAGGQIYKLTNWSFGGLNMVTRAERLLPGQVLHMMIRFQIGEKVIEAMQTGNVVRAGDGDAAVSFTDPVQPGTLRCFRQVLDLRAQRG